MAAWWAATWSGGRSSFTPVAVGFAVALALAVDGNAARTRRLTAAQGVEPAVGHVKDIRVVRPSRRRYVIPAVLAGLFIVAVALFYGSTIALSPRDGVQPIIERDTAYYAILARDLAGTGTETTLGPSGFSDLPGFPVQVWYHWGEVWLASAVISIFGIAPMDARHFIVLPIVLLAAVALAGTLVRRVAGTNSRLAFLFGVSVLLFLAPVPLVPGPFFSHWAVGLLSGITLYGMGAVAAILAMYLRTVLGRRESTWGLAAFVGSAVAFILSAHIAIAVLGFVGVAGVGALRILQSLVVVRRLPSIALIWRRCGIAGVVVLGATIVWGFLTGHGLLGSSAAASVVAPFNAAWRETIVLITAFSGAFLAIPMVWWRIRGTPRPATDLYLGVMGLLVAGAIGWGARAGEFTMFYLLFAGIAAYATPLAAAAIRMLRDQLRDLGHLLLAALIVALCMTQLLIGVYAVTLRLQGLGTHSADKPTPLSLLGSIRQMPPDAKLAYACGPTEEIAFGVPQLLTIDAETARRVVPMCFEADHPSFLLGAEQDMRIVGQFFRGAPQHELYPSSTATPSSTAILDFLDKYGIDYIYADARHPNTLVPDAVVIASSGDSQVLQVP